MPSDQLDAVTKLGVTDVRIAIVSLSARSPAGHDAAYLEWHGLDHLPEQYRIAGLRCGTRWVSTAECRAARSVGVRPYEAVDHVVAYLFAEPVGRALDTFFALGADLASNGRLPLRLPAVELAGYRLVARAASDRVLVGADVLPWRPSRGVYLLIEEGEAPLEPLLRAPGVAGYWSFEGGADLSPRLTDARGVRLTVCYLDADPVATAVGLRPLLDQRWATGEVRPRLAAPFVTVVPWAWDRSLPG